MRLVLASGSPRRRRLLAVLGMPFDVVPADVDESVVPGESPVEHVRRLALCKLDAVSTVSAVSTVGTVGTVDRVVLAADTTVELGGEILGKPVDPGDARRMLRALSGRTHLVHTAVAVRGSRGTEHELVTTSVTMVPLGDAAVEWYVATGEPLDKAGAYAIQGAGGAFVASISGSASNVVGLPLATVVELLGRHGLDLAR